MNVEIGFDLSLRTSAPQAGTSVRNVHPDRAHDVLRGDVATVEPSLVLTG